MDYPKMLYKGNLVSFLHVVANDDEHEEELKSEGWIEHHELEEPDEGPEDVKASEEPEEIDLSAYIPVEQFDAIAEKLTQAEEQLGTAKTEFHSRMNDLQLENQKLKEELAAAPASAGVPQEVYDAVYQEREQLKQENAQLKYSAMGANELRAILDEKGVKYGSRDEKPALVKLVLDNQ